MNPSELLRQREILEGAPIGVVEASLDGFIQYANRHAMQLLGVTSYEGLHLRSLYADPAMLKDQIESRRAGQIGNYKTRLVRQSDGETLPIKVTAIPILDGDGSVTGSFAVFRHPLEEEINRIHQEVDDPRSVLFLVMQELHKVIPFDLATATRFSDDMQHAQPFFVYRPGSRKTRVEWKQKWQTIPPEMLPQFEDTGTVLLTDLMARLADPAVGALRQSPLVVELVSEGMQTCIRRPLARKDKVIASVAFYSRDPGALTEAHRALVQGLPLAASVIQAIEHFNRRRESEQYKLLREVAFCPTVEAVYDTLLRRLCDIFVWSNAAIYRVDHARSRIRLVAACTPPHAPVTKGLTYEQDIGQGVLGRVVKSGIAQIVGELADDPDYVPNDPPTSMRSEMCWPIRLDDSKVRWIIDVEDTRPEAFAEEEKRWLGETAQEVGGFMQRLSTLNFLSECLEHTSEPIVVVDAHNHIKRANPAAAAFFGVSDHKDLTGGVEALFTNPEGARRALVLPDGYLGEFDVGPVRPGGALPADVSRTALPDDIGGAIYVFKDMRPIRRVLELELMEQTAYEIALETRTPLTYAVLALERAIRHRDGLEVGSCERVLKYLYRTQHAYTKLAMFNASVRNSACEPRSLDLIAEMRAIHSSLPDEMSSLVKVPPDNDVPARIVADCFQVSFILETLLMFFVRTAPEEIPVVVNMVHAAASAEPSAAAEASADPANPARSDPAARVGVSVEGFLPKDWPLSGEVTSEGAGERGDRRQTDLRLAYPPILDYAARNRGTCVEERLPDQRVRYTVLFPQAS